MKNYLAITDKRNSAKVHYFRLNSGVIEYNQLINLRPHYDWQRAIDTGYYNLLDNTVFAKYKAIAHSNYRYKLGLKVKAIKSYKETLNRAIFKAPKINFPNGLDCINGEESMPFITSTPRAYPISYSCLPA